jgi:hypothetical protein
MKKIKVGEYMRTKYSGIFKIKDIDFEKFEIIQDNNRVWEFDDLEEMEDFIFKSIVKHSPNIIDLIEAGDYVNGYKIIADDSAVLPDCKHAFVVFERNGTSFLKIWGETDIKSIVTKEQFESMKYEVK